MPAGLQVFRDNGAFQIDGSNPNLVLTASGYAVESVTFASPAIPIVFYRPIGSFGSYPYMLRDNGNGTFTYSAKGPFYYWAYAEMSAADSPGFGLQIFNETGRQVYASHKKPLRLIGRIEIPSLPNVPQGWDFDQLLVSYSQYAGHNYAFAFSGMRKWRSSVAPIGSFPGRWYSMLEALRVSDAGFEIWAAHLTSITNFQGGSVFWNNWPIPTLLVANVQGH